MPLLARALDRLEDLHRDQLEDRARELAQRTGTPYLEALRAVEDEDSRRP